MQISPGYPKNVLRHGLAALASLAAVLPAFFVGIGLLDMIAPEMVDLGFEPFCGCFWGGLILIDIMAFVLPLSVLAERILSRYTHWTWWLHIPVL